MGEVDVDPSEVAEWLRLRIRPGVLELGELSESGEAGVAGGEVRFWVPAGEGMRGNETLRWEPRPCGWSMPAAASCALNNDLVIADRQSSERWFDW